MENELSHQFQARKQAQEKDRYQEGYKQEVLEDLQQPSEETQYKQLFKQSLLAQLGISDEKDSSKEAKKEAEAEKAPVETPQEKEERLAKMKEFEQKHSFDKVYKLKKEVLQELKELNLTDSQREKLTKLEKALDTEKKDHDKQKKEEKSQNGFTKFFARNNGALSSKKQKDQQEIER
ncbi:hypothetical protein RKD56_000374 [Priestia megaterium]